MKYRKFLGGLSDGKFDGVEESHDFDEITVMVEKSECEIERERCIS